MDAAHIAHATWQQAGEPCNQLAGGVGRIGIVLDAEDAQHRVGVAEGAQMFTTAFQPFIRIQDEVPIRIGGLQRSVAGC